VAATTADDWVYPTSPSKNAKPAAIVDLFGKDASGNLAPLVGLDMQGFAANPVEVHVQNNFDSTDTANPYVGSGNTIAYLEISWYYQPPGANPVLVDMSNPPFNIVPEIIAVNLFDPGGTIYALYNFVLDSGVASWPSGVAM
jgi:hypothetical protein